jgi:hypothetical protein
MVGRLKFRFALRLDDRHGRVFFQQYCLGEDARATTAGALAGDA